MTTHTIYFCKNLEKNDKYPSGKISAEQKFGVSNLITGNNKVIRQIRMAGKQVNQIESYGSYKTTKTQR